MTGDLAQAAPLATDLVLDCVRVLEPDHRDTPYNRDLLAHATAGRRSPFVELGAWYPPIGYSSGCCRRSENSSCEKWLLEHAVATTEPLCA